MDIFKIYEKEKDRQPSPELPLRKPRDCTGCGCPKNFLRMKLRFPAHEIKIPCA